LRQTVWGVFLTVRPYGFSQKHRNAKPDGLKSKFPNSGRLFWFVFWFYGDSTQVTNDVTGPDENADYTESIDFIQFFEGSPEFKVVRAAGVEPTTFSSGG
jgi:hypothetical protein